MSNSEIDCILVIKKPQVNLVSRSIQQVTLMTLFGVGGVSLFLHPPLQKRGAFAFEMSKGILGPTQYAKHKNVKVIRNGITPIPILLLDMSFRQQRSNVPRCLRH